MRRTLRPYYLLLRGLTMYSNECRRLALIEMRGMCFVQNDLIARVFLDRQSLTTRFHECKAAAIIGHRKWNR